MMDAPASMIPLAAYVTVSAILFMTGLIGVLIRRNFIIVLMCVEIMLNAANINLVAFSHYLESMVGQLAALFGIGHYHRRVPRKNCDQCGSDQHPEVVTCSSFSSSASPCFRS